MAIWDKIGRFLGHVFATVIVVLAIAIIASFGLKCLWFIWFKFLMW